MGWIRPKSLLGASRGVDGKWDCGFRGDFERVARVQGWIDGTGVTMRHDVQVPISCIDTHSAATAAIRAAGVASAPTAVNSVNDVVWPCWCSTRRHSMVASEPV